MQENSREYWNRPEVRKRSLVTSVFSSIFYIVVIYLFYLTYTDHPSIPLFMVVLGIWLTKKDINEIQRKTSHPLCRLTDEFIIFDLDRKVIPWNVVTRIDVDSTKKEVEIQHVPIKDSPKKSLKSVKIYLKWIQNWDVFLEDLKAECEKRSIEFTVK